MQSGARLKTCYPDAESTTTSSSDTAIGARLRDKVTIVTGAAGGIGQALVRRFAMEGARVVLADRAEENAQAIAASLPAAAANFLVRRCDVNDEKSVAACVDATLEHFGRLDGVVNNAGAMSFNPLTAWTRADWERMLGVDLLGAAFFSSEGLRRMNAGGAIVNIASIHAVMTTPGVAPYAAAKAALLSLTRSTAIEGKARHIRANAILPGAIDTPMLWNNPNIKAGTERIDKYDVGTPEDIANAALYLISDEARFVTGASLVVDGGRTVRL